MLKSDDGLRNYLGCSGAGEPCSERVTPAPAPPHKGEGKALGRPAAHKTIAKSRRRAANDMRRIAFPASLWAPLCALAESRGDDPRDLARALVRQALETGAAQALLAGERGAVMAKKQPKPDAGLNVSALVFMMADHSRLDGFCPLEADDYVMACDGRLGLGSVRFALRSALRAGLVSLDGDARERRYRLTQAGWKMARGAAA
jgi:hypothetical protein